MMKKLLLLFMLTIVIANLNAQYSVTLKVIDNQDGALTNNVNDNNETNVFCWAGNDDGTLYTGDWWYPMYAGEAGRTGAILTKDNGAWIWQCTIDNVTPGDYRWNPHMKTLGWASINNLYNYGDDANIHFSIAQDGTVSGQTILELPLTPTSSKDEKENEMRVYGRDKVVVISNVKAGTEIFIFNLSGTLVAQTKSSSTIAEIPVGKSGIYLVKSANSSSKVLVK